MVFKSNLNKNFLPFEAFNIPEKFQKKAEDELNEEPENRILAIKELRECTLNEKGLSCRTSDEFLIQFLRARKFDIPKALGLLKKCMHFKTKNQKVFTGMNYDVLVKLIKNKVMGFLPYRCSEGCALLAVQLDNWNPTEISIDDIMRGIALYLFHSICDPLTQVNGYKVILNVKSHPLKHLRFCTPQNLYLLYTGTQECFPGRFKGIHIVSMSLAFKAAWTIVQPFLSEKLKKRIQFHQNNDTLTNHFDESILPVEFGGKLKEYDTSPWLKNALLEENLEKLAN